MTVSAPALVVNWANRLATMVEGVVGEGQAGHVTVDQSHLLAHAEALGVG